MDSTLSTESQNDDVFHIEAQSDIFDINCLEKIITLVLTGYKQNSVVMYHNDHEIWGGYWHRRPPTKNFWGDRSPLSP
jgi:hypothetical protein